MKKTKKMIVPTILAVMVLMLVVPSGGITNGELDGESHPYVGLMVALDANDNPLWRCSGTLLSAQLYLTAGHCTEAPAVRATIWFDTDVESGIPGNGYPFAGEVSGDAFTHPEYQNPYPWFMKDLGVVVRDEPMEMDEYGVLPVLDQLDDLAKKRGHKDLTFTAVGYGLQQAGPVPSGRDIAERVRMVAYPKLNQINAPGFTGDFSLLLSNNHATGGTCFGDSGGPNFLGTSNVVAGVTSYGLNGNCAGTGGVYRVDRADDLDWLYGTFGAYLP
jgi:hypothetical protein